MILPIAHPGSPGADAAGKSWRRKDPEDSCDRQRTEDDRRLESGNLLLVQLFAIGSLHNLAARTSYAPPINQLLKHSGSIASRAPH
jgi:hypothetical protein